MRVYMNYHNYTFILTREVLEIMGRPRYVYFIVSKQKNRVICLPMKSRRTDLAGCPIPESVYKNNGGYAVWADHSFLEQMYFLSDVSGVSTYAIEVRLLPVNEIKAGELHGLERGIKPKGIPVVFDMMTADAAEMNECPVYTFGGNRVA